MQTYKKHEITTLGNSFDSHVHSPYSACCEDITFEKLRKKAKEKNIDYAITDHSTHLYFPRKLAWSLHNKDFKKLFAEYRDYGRDKIKRYIEDVKANGPMVGIELDIYSDGTLVFEEDLFDELDIVIGSIHYLSSLVQKQSTDEIIREFRDLTERIISSGCIDILGHPFRILELNNISPDNQLISWAVKCCKKYDVAIELNSHHKYPENDEHMVNEAFAKNVKISYGSDAHSISEFGDFSYHRTIIEKIKNITQNERS